jgi:uncharacterized membrane protein YhaH (DUF805 family)
MRKYASMALAVMLALLPVIWVFYLLTQFTCQLGVYAREWRTGTMPGWLPLWLLGVTSAGLAIVGIVAPKIWRWYKKGKPLTPGEWISLVLVALLIGVIAKIAPAAMRSPRAEFAEFMGHAAECPK